MGAEFDRAYERSHDERMRALLAEQRHRYTLDLMHSGTRLLLWGIGFFVAVATSVILHAISTTATSIIESHRLECPDQHADQGREPHALGGGHVLPGHQPGALLDSVPDRASPGGSTGLGDVGGVERTREDFVRSVGHTVDCSVRRAQRGREMDDPGCRVWEDGWAP